MVRSDSSVALMPLEKVGIGDFYQSLSCGVAVAMMLQLWP